MTCADVHPAQWGGWMLLVATTMMAATTSVVAYSHPQFSIQQLMTASFPHRISDDIYMDPCKAGESGFLLFRSRRAETWPSECVLPAGILALLCRRMPNAADEQLDYYLQYHIIDIKTYMLLIMFVRRLCLLFSTSEA